MARLLLVLCVFLILDIEVEAKRRPLKKVIKKVKHGDVANQLASLQQNLTSLWSEVKEMGSSRVNVHVHGMGHDAVHGNDDGTHVHIHMHMGAGGHMDENTYVYGHCEMMMNPTLKKSPHEIKGAVHFRQKMHQPLEMIIHLKGFHVPKGDNPDHSHTQGLHVHEFGDLSNGCQSFGDHFDPHGKENDHDHDHEHEHDHEHDHSEHGHGHEEKSHSRHAGDLADMTFNDAGEVHMNTNGTMASLFGTHSIIGRGILIHEHTDTHGNEDVEASQILACCVVARAGEHEWSLLEKHQH